MLETGISLLLLLTLHQLGSLHSHFSQFPAMVLHSKMRFSFSYDEWGGISSWNRVDTVVGLPVSCTYCYKYNLLFFFHAVCWLFSCIRQNPVDSVFTVTSLSSWKFGKSFYLKNDLFVKLLIPLFKSFSVHF